MHIEFYTPGTVTDVGRLVTFLEAQDLGYKNYSDWLEKTTYELLDGKKQSIVARSEGKIVGDLVYQDHKDLEGVLELKNLRIHPGMRERYFARFMLKQMEQEHKDKVILCDARSSQQDMAGFLMRVGYTPVMELNLYDKNETDIVFAKFYGQKIEELKQHFS